jgi:hypothetical protein
MESKINEAEYHQDQDLRKNSLQLLILEKLFYDLSK